MRNPSTKTAVWAMGGVGLLLLAAVVFALLRPTTTTNPAPTVRTVTMDGGGEVSTINLWDDYQTRGRVTGKAQSGDRVTLLQQSGAGCEVETNAGQRGWVTCSNFIKELK